MIPPSTSKLNEIHPSASATAPAKTQWPTRRLICAVSEVLWCRMTVNKSRERLIHSQSIRSPLSASILDSFGLACATVAAYRLLGYLDVDLALSEDHGWVEFGPPDARQTADVASWVPGAHLLTARESDAPDNTVEPGSECGSQDDTGTKIIRLRSVFHLWSVLALRKRSSGDLSTVDARCCCSSCRASAWFLSTGLSTSTYLRSVK
ncbi:DnaJ subfamily B [Fasciola hepatica]|uniref:Menin n=1 Tax=Fasciola hepatica TaxID=6192 RepID=A0A4E0QT85_FASHE|nr:DnaJ subfamily B [Fasciola hepatica]